MRFTDTKRLADMSFSVKNNVIALSFLIPYTFFIRCKVSGGYEKIFILTLSSLKILNDKYKQPFLLFHYIIFYFTLSLYKSTGFKIFLNFFINFIKILYNYKKLDLFFKITWYFNKFLYSKNISTNFICLCQCLIKQLKTQLL